MVLDVVVAVQVVEELAGDAGEAAGVGARLAVAVEEAAGLGQERGLHPAEAEVHLHPEAGELGEVRMRLPLEAGVLRDEDAERVRQAGAGGEGEVFQGVSSRCGRRTP